MTMLAAQPSPAPRDRLPLDHPSLRQAHRLYFVLTNHCNYSCPWCSMYSSPAGKTWMKLEDYRRVLGSQGRCEIQLEGGEPTLHPQFGEFVRLAREHEGCFRLVVCTNGSILPRNKACLRAWLESLGEDCVLKLSVNHYLLGRNPDLLRLAVLVRDILKEMGGRRMLVLNVRLRKGVEDDDARVIEAVRGASLLPQANVFYLRRYGLAARQTGWEAPVWAGHNFTMINPDGRLFGPDFVVSSEAMRDLP